MVAQEERHPAWQHLVLASCAAGAATAVTHPIDTTKTKLQLHPSAKPPSLLSIAVAATRQKPVALFNGLSAALLRNLTYSSVRLGMYQPYQHALAEVWPVEASESCSAENVASPLRLAFIKLGAGVLSGTTGAVIGNPFELLKVRLQGRRSSVGGNILTTTKHIVRNEGFKGLYRGLVPACLRSSLLTSSQLLTYDASKSLLVSKCGLDGGGYTCQVGCALLSGVAATTMSTPADVIKTRMMNTGSATGGGTVAVLRQVWKEGALFRGWTGNYIRLGPHTLIALVVYERLRKLVGWTDL